MHNLDKVRLVGILNDRIFVGPKTVFVQVTNVCNLRCVYCWYHSSLKSAPARSRDGKKELDYAVFKKVMDDCSGLGVQRVQISAKGEPTLHPRIIEMIDYVKEKKFQLIFFTNATFGDDVLGHLAKADEISVDLSAANADDYGKLQSRDLSNFKRVLKNLSFFSALKKKKKKAPFIILTYILNARNYRQLPEIFKIARGLDIDQLHIKNIDVFQHSTPLALTKPIRREIEGIFLKMLKERYFLDVKSNVKSNYFQHNRFLDELYLNKVMRPKACYQGWHYSFITPEGNVTPCCKMHKDLVVGNVYDRPFKDIWHSGNFHKIRLEGKRTLYNKKYDACKQCCFYSLNEKIREELEYLKTPLRTPGTLF